MGLIPAHAGKTNEVIIFGPFLWAHPRSRGENCMCVLFLCRLLGSSPLTRGKLRRKSQDFVAVRLIPAHAGKTFRVWPCRQCAGAHPRSRGENHFRFCSPLQLVGSSPLTRGKLNVCDISVSFCGLIPAHAGKTLFSRRAGG